MVKYILSDECGDFRTKKYFLVGLLFAKNKNFFLNYINKLRQEYNYWREIKYSKSDILKIPICKNIINMFFNFNDLSFACIIVSKDKHNIEYFKNNTLGYKPDDLAYNHKYKLVISHNIIAGQRYILYRDKRQQTKKTKLDEYLRREIKQIADIIPLESKNNDLLQLCDLQVGSVYEDFAKQVKNKDSPKKIIINHIKRHLRIKDFLKIDWNLKNKFNVWYYDPHK